MDRQPAQHTRSVSLQAALLTLLGVALLVGLIPAGLVLDRWLQQEIEARAWRDVALAPALLADRNKSTSDALMMHAKDLAHSPELVAALSTQDRARAVVLAEDAARALKHSAILIQHAGAQWRGPAVPDVLVQATRNGQMPVAVVSDSTGLYLVSLAPIQRDREWIGAAGVASPLDESAAGALAALTRSDLVILLAPSGARSVHSANLPAGPAIEVELRRQSVTDSVREVTVADRSYLLAAAELGGATVGFVRDLRRDMSLLPRLRRVLMGSGAAALVVALLLGSLLALTLLRPVRVLAAAADRLSQGDFSAPLPSSGVRELGRVSAAFGAMRSALGLRIDELRTANRMLEERQTRLAALQAELIQRERVAVSGRMAAELAHEIRNPIANLRNCLELLYRRLEEDPTGREFASLAIDELLRMHELAERMLDLHRPHDAGLRECDATKVVTEVAALARVGSADGSIVVRLHAAGPARAAIPPDALKQILLNLVQNAREAKPKNLQLDIRVSSNDSQVTIALLDNGPGVPKEIRARVFDPFVTTRSRAGGMGLGLFVVEGIVRGHGGTVSLESSEAGACFCITLPAPAAEEAVPMRSPAAALS